MICKNFKILSFYIIILIIYFINPIYTQLQVKSATYCGGYLTVEVFDNDKEIPAQVLVKNNISCSEIELNEKKSVDFDSNGIYKFKNVFQCKIQDTFFANNFFLRLYYTNNITTTYNDLELLDDCSEFYPATANSSNNGPKLWIIAPVVCLVLIIATILIVLFIYTRKIKFNLEKKKIKNYKGPTFPEKKYDEERIPPAVKSTNPPMFNPPQVMSSLKQSTPYHHHHHHQGNAQSVTINDSSAIMKFDPTLGSNRLVAGTIDRIIQHLCFSRFANIDVIKSFLLGFRALSTRSELLDQLIKCYLNPQFLDLNSLASTDRIRQRVGTIIHLWLEYHYYDFEGNNQLLDQLDRFCEDYLKVDCPELYSAIRLVRVNKMAKPIGGIPPAPSDADMMKIDISPANTLSSNIKNNGSILNCSTTYMEIEFMAEEPASVIAKRLSLVERDMIQSIPVEEFYAELWIYEDMEYKQPHIDRFKQHSEHISKTVIKEVTSVPENSERIKKVSRFIEIASELTLHKNFNGAYEILYALDQLLGTKSGQKDLWDHLPPASLSIYSTLIYKFSSADNYKVYRDYLKQDKSLPIFNIVLSDFSNIIQSSSEYIGNIEDKIIEFDRYWRLWQLICDYQKCFDNYQIDD